MPSRRDFLRTTGVAAGGVLLAGSPLAARRVAATSVREPSAAVVLPAAWQQRWSPDPALDGLAAFETIEDDRANSHPAGQPHIFVEADHYRFNMHTVDRD